MDKVYAGILVLAGVGLLGIVGLVAIGKPVDVLVPIVSALVGYLVGKRQDNIVGAVKGVFGK